MKPLVKMCFSIYLFHIIYKKGLMIKSFQNFKNIIKKERRIFRQSLRGKLLSSTKIFGLSNLEKTQTEELVSAFARISIRSGKSLTIQLQLQMVKNDHLLFNNTLRSPSYITDENLIFGSLSLLHLLTGICKPSCTKMVI
jgi:hypothetical protein